MKTGSKAFCKKHYTAYDIGEGCADCQATMVEAEKPIVLPLPTQPLIIGIGISASNKLVIDAYNFDHNKVYIGLDLTKGNYDIIFNKNCGIVFFHKGITCNSLTVGVGTHVTSIGDIIVLESFISEGIITTYKGGIIVEGNIIASSIHSACGINAGGLIQSFNEIRANYGISAKSYIQSSATISTHDDIYAGPGGIKAKNIKANTIDTEGSIEADNIKSNHYIRAKGTISVVDKISAGAACYSITVNTDKTVFCSKLLSGILSTDSILVETGP